MFEPDNSEMNLEQQVVQDTSESELPNELVVSILEDENDSDFSAGDLSLREAIALANEQEGEDTITFDSSLSGGTININSSLERELLINDSVAINGLGQDNLTLDGGFIFTPQTDVDLAIDGLNLTGGRIDSFGDLTLTNSTLSQIVETSSFDNSSINSKGTAIISNSTIKDNSGIQNVGILIESGTATIENSTISNNNAPSIAVAGVIISRDATVNIINSTIADNSSRANAGILNSGTANVTNSTIVNNDGGIGIGGILNSGTATVTSSIVANNIDGIPVEGDISTNNGEFTSGGNNLISNSDNITNLVDSDIVGTGDNPLDVQLGELQDNGGSTETLALLEGSLAIDAGSNFNNLETDQRGEGFNRTVGNGTDIGAYEVQEGGGEVPTDLVVSILEDENDGDFSAGDLSLREAIAISQSDDTITFDPSLSGSTITLTQGELLVDNNFLTIQGLGAENITIDGGGSDNFLDGTRVFNINNNSDIEAEIVINDLTITGGGASFNKGSAIGAGIFNTENLEINNAIIRDNTADGGGGGIFSEGTLSVNNSAIYSNSAQRRGGAGGGIF